MIPPKGEWDEINVAIIKNLQKENKQLRIAAQSVLMVDALEGISRSVHCRLDLLSRLFEATDKVDGPLKECKGKSAARALAVMVLDPKISQYLSDNDPKALEQAQKALVPFGFPAIHLLREKFGL